MSADTIERDEDRLPWLETVDDGHDERPPMARMIVLVLVGLAAIAAAVAGIYWYQDRPVAGGTGELIAAQEGDYKVKPDAPGGMQAGGEGDSVFATSEGGASNASVDLSAVPEAAVKTGKGAPKAAATPVVAGGRRVGADVPPPAGRLSATAPATATPPPPASGAGGGAVVQLGSFPSEAVANAAWKQLAGRFGYLAGLGQSVQAAEVNGRTVHRLRVNAGSNPQAREICGKLKVAGEGCFVVS